MTLQEIIQHNNDRTLKALLSTFGNIIGNPRERQAKTNLAKNGVEEAGRDGSLMGRGTDQNT